MQLSVGCRDAVDPYQVGGAVAPRGLQLQDDLPRIPDELRQFSASLSRREEGRGVMLDVAMA